MYRCKLDIRIFSEDPLLLADVRNIAPLERFEHDVSGYRSFSPEAVRGSDIIVLDLPVAERPEAVRALCKPGAILVFCMEAEAFAVLRTPSLEAADDIWVKPFHRDFGAVRFKKILAGIKHRKDSRLTQTYLDTIIDSIPDLIWFKDVKGSHLKVNNGFCHAVGKKKEDVQGRGHYYIWDLKKEEYEQGEYICLESDEIVLEERRTCLFDEMVKSKQGMRQFKTYKSPLFDDDGTILGTVGIAHDVTDLANMGAELEIFLRNMPFAILISGNDGRIINVNAKFEEYFAAKEKNIVGKPYEEWKHVIQKSLCKTYGEGHFEIRLHGDGEERILEFHEEPIFDVFRNRVGQFCFCRDVTIERTFEHQIWISANTDALTGLYNRRFFYEYMNENRKENQLSLLYVDLDDFKKVNDAHGHHIGDGALYLAAALLPLPYAVAAGAIGAALADVFASYAIWAPFTFAIKALMVLCVGRLCKAGDGRGRLAGASLLAGGINVALYFLSSCVLYGAAGAAAGIPFNILQSAVAAVIFIVLLPGVKKALSGFLGE